MNYYEHHIGDYLKKTAHLSMLEEGAYRRLLDVYYTHEKPLPTALKDCCKLARAQSKPERDAVAYVLGEFFQLESDGHHQTRCDDEIGAYLDKVPEAEKKRANDRERQNRSRDRRKALFNALRDHGIVAPWNAKTSWLETELSRVTKTTSNEPVTRDNTATQSPVPSPQTPNPISSALGSDTPSRESDPPQRTLTNLAALGKFQMRRDWSPPQDMLAAVCAIAGASSDLITPAAVASFREYWAEEQAAYTERQWVGKLLDSARRQAAKSLASRVADDGQTPAIDIAALAAEFSK